MSIHTEQTDRPSPMKTVTNGVQEQDWRSSSDHIQGMQGQRSVLTNSLATGPFCHLLPIFSHLLLLKSP